MALLKRKAEHEDDRTEILRYLNERGLMPVTPRSIFIYLDDIRRTVSLEGIHFHLRYMRDKGWVEMEDEKVVGDRPGSPGRALPPLAWMNSTAEQKHWERRCDEHASIHPRIIKGT